VNKLSENIENKKEITKFEKSNFTKSTNF